MKILMYHYVKKKPSEHFRNLKFLSEARFIAQLRKIISSKERVYSLEDLLHEKAKDKKNPDSGWLLTFDDGLFDHYSTVADILEQFNLPAIFFISTGGLNGKFLRVHLLQHLIASFSSDNEFVDFMHLYFARNNINVSRLPKDYAANRWDNNSLSAIKFLIQSVVSEEEAHYLLKDIFKQRNIEINKELHEKIYLKEAHIRELSSRFNLGLHSHEHNRFSTMNSRQIKQDLILNINYLSSLGLNCKSQLSLALPYGSQAKKSVVDLYDSLNISHIFTTKPESYTGKDRRSIPRYDCNDFNSVFKN